MDDCKLPPRALHTTREKESPSHMHFGHCWTLFGVWCSVALFGSVVPEGRRSCAVVSADRGPEGRGRGVPQGYQVSLFSHVVTPSGVRALYEHHGSSSRGRDAATMAPILSIVPTLHSSQQGGCGALPP